MLASAAGGGQRAFEIGDEIGRLFEADMQPDEPRRYAEGRQRVRRPGLDEADLGRKDEALVAAPAHAEAEQVQPVAQHRNVDRGSHLEAEEA